MMMKKQVVVLCWYTVSSDYARGILAVDHSIGLISLNAYSERFSDPETGITVQFAEINKGFSVSGSQNNRPLSEENLQYYAALIIVDLINEFKVAIEWSSHDFLADRQPKQNRRCPQFGSGGKTSVLPVFMTHATTLAGDRDLSTAAA